MLKNSHLELEKDFENFKDRELNIRKETEELFSKLIIISRDDMDKLNKKK